MKNSAEKKRKIMYYAPRFHTNQIHCIKSLIERNISVEFCVVNRGKSEDYSVIKPHLIKTNFLYDILSRINLKYAEPMYRAKYAILSNTDIFCAIRKFKPHCIIIRDPVSIPGIQFTIFALLNFIKIIVYTQSPKYRKKVTYLNKAAYFVYVKLLKASWFTPCLGNVDDRSISFEKIKYIPFVMEVNRRNEFPAYNDDIVHLISIGKFEKRKNHSLLIEVLSEIKDQYKFELSIFGECTTNEHRMQYESIMTLIQKLSMKNKVHLYSNLPYHELSFQYRNYDLFILPSTQEPASISNLEAMANGLAVICSDTNGTACYTNDGVDGFIFRDNNKMSLKEVLKKALSSKKNLKQMGNNAMIKCQREHNGQSYFNAIIELMENSI